MFGKKFKRLRPNKSLGTIKFITFFSIQGIVFLLSSPVQALEYCFTDQKCNWVTHPGNVTLFCTPVNVCVWIPDDPATPVPPAPPPPPPPPPKTPEQIELEQHVIFCRSQAGKINLAVSTCKNAGLGYNSYFISSVCAKGGGTWAVGGSYGIFNASYSGAASGEMCLAQANANLNAFQSECTLKGDQYMNALVQQCSDVNM